MTTTLTIEDALRKIAADNDLTNVGFSLSLNQVSPDWIFGAVVHWDG